jgi:hypothetical protein
MNDANMSTEEREIWRAAYAAAFVADFERKHEYYRNDLIAGSPFDEAARVVYAERAITVADLAIVRLRQWRDDNDALAGCMLKPHPKEWDE